VRRRVLLQQELVDRPVPVHGRGDVARRDTVGIVGEQSRDLARRQELGEDLATVPLAGDRVVEREAALLEHLPDEQIELGQDVARGILQLLGQRLPAALPFVAVESRFEHRLLPSPRRGLSKPPTAAVRFPA